MNVTTIETGAGNYESMWCSNAQRSTKLFFLVILALMLQHIDATTLSNGLFFIYQI